MRKLTTLLAALAALSCVTAGCDSGQWEPAKTGDSIALPPPPENSVERDDMVDAFADDEPEAAPATSAAAAAAAPAASGSAAAPAGSAAKAPAPAKKAPAPATKAPAPAKKPPAKATPAKKK